MLSGVKGAAAATELVAYHLQAFCTWDGRRLKKVSSRLVDAAFRFFPEYKFKRSTWYDFVRRHMADEVAHRIVYHSPVAEVDYSGERVQV